MMHDRDERLGCLGGGDALDDIRGQVEHRRTTLDGLTPWGHELGLDLPAGGDGLLQQPGALHHEHTFVGTRTAAPQEAPQSLNLCVRIGELVAQSAALACSTTALKAAASVMARSDSILRSTSMPAALRPAMNRL